MLDDLTKFADHFFAAQRQFGVIFANWFIHQIKRIPEPARKYLPLPKSEHPATYEIVEPGQYD